MADAEAAVRTLRRSITELCVADHQNEAGKLEPWLRNKTVADWANWLERDDAVVFVAERDGEVVGVGATALRGEILLNYVHPDARFAGVSKAMLAALEAVLRGQGVARSRLKSTVTARAFYEGRGYIPDASGECLGKDL